MCVYACFANAVSFNGNSLSLCNLPDFVLHTQFQVSNMADEFTRKLRYLHVTNEGLSEIQLLSIQLQVSVLFEALFSTVQCNLINVQTTSL